jgi:hypothetical protein
MQFRLTIDCDNAAFEDNGIQGELSSILHDIANRLMENTTEELIDMGSIILRDTNGNTVGAAKLIND